MSIYDKILKCDKKILVVLIDPDKVSNSYLGKILKYSENFIDFIFVGGSIVNNSTDDLVLKLKKNTKTPIIIFPGNPSQISYKADAILYLSLISGRNPDYLIGHHVNSAYSLKKSKIEVIPTGYILIKSNKISTTEYISNTKPIPNDKPEIVVSTAVAGELLGMKMIYLEAGSGADDTVNSEIIKKVKNNISIPLAVGGGIKNTDDLYKTAVSGSDVLVVGTAFEDDADLIPEFYKTLKKI